MSADHAPASPQPIDQSTGLTPAAAPLASPSSSPAIVRQWLTEARVTEEVARNVERMAGADDVRQVVLLPDLHLGRNVNNGCVAATVDLVYPQAVGSDIGCGFSALAFEAGA